VAVLSGALGVHQLTSLDVNWIHRLDWLHFAAESLLPFALTHVALTFPRPFQIVRDQPRIAVPLYGIGFTVFCVEQLLWAPHPERWILVARMVELLTLIAGLWVLGRVVVALGPLAGGSEKYRARILAYGAAFAFGFPAVCFLVDLAVHANLVGAVLPFSWAVVPISIGLAVGRRDLFDLDDRYRLLLLPIGATAACVFGLFLGLVLIFRLLGFQQPLVEPAFGIAFLISTALLLEAGRGVVLRGVEHLRPSPESRLRRLLEKAGDRDPSRGGSGAAAEFLIEYLMGELHPAFAAVIHIDPEDHRLRVFRARGELPAALQRLDLGLDSIVAERLLGSSTYVTHPELSDAERREWVSCGLEPIELALTLRLGERGFGALVIGRTGGTLSRSDLELLRLLAQATALGLREARRLEITEQTLRGRSHNLARALERLREKEDGRCLVVEPEERFVWVGKLAAGVAHEASKPLYVIRHHIARLLRRPTADTRRLRAIAAEVEHVSRLIGDLQAYARSHTVSRESVAIRGLLDELVAEQANPLDVEASGDLGLEARADPALLLTLLRSLLENAREAGATRISVALETEGNRVVVRVTDDGPGVPEGLGDRVFEPFFSTKQTGRASGLGLAIAREIAQSHGGTLELLLGEPGTSFELRLPAA
jgi:signal transduction histidine kinase